MNENKNEVENKVELVEETLLQNVSGGSEMEWCSQPGVGELCSTTIVIPPTIER